MIEFDTWINNEMLAVCLIDELTRKGSCDINLLKEVVGSLKENNSYRIALEDLVKQKRFSQGLLMLGSKSTSNPI